MNASLISVLIALVILTSIVIGYFKVSATKRLCPACHTMMPLKKMTCPKCGKGIPLNY
jgi:ribosomal protein S27AE